MAGRKLKVFQAQFGFYDTVVAAPSKAAALRAWGTRQDLFATGEARGATDEAAIAAAAAHPETPLRRAVGSDDPFVLEPTGLPRIPDAAKGPSRGSRAAAKARPATERAARPPPDRSRLDAAEAALATLDAGRKKEEADLRREAEALDTRRAAAQTAYVEARKAASARVAAAQAAYRKAGGG